MKIQHFICKCGMKSSLPENYRSTDNCVVRIKCWGDPKLRRHLKIVGKGYDVEIDVTKKIAYLCDPGNFKKLSKFDENIEELFDKKDIFIDFNSATVYVIANIKDVCIVTGKFNIIYIIDRDCIDVDRLNTYKYSIICENYIIEPLECKIERSSNEIKFICPNCNNVLARIKLR